MYVSAVSSFFNPYDVARVAGIRNRAEQAESQSQQTAQQALPERIIQGEVVSRERLQNTKTSTTNDTLSNRQFNQQQSAYGFNARQAVNAYISNQVSGDAIDKNRDSDQLIDVYV